MGDNTRGGALVTMYAKGDTSNVTIPALFTSRTTAHLLSSLIPPEAPGIREETLPEESGAEFESDNPLVSPERSEDRPTFTPTAFTPRPSTPLHDKGAARRPGSQVKGQSISDHNRQSWLRYLFGRKARRDVNLSENDAEADSRRPPSSGRLTWVNEEWTESATTSSGGKSLSGQKDPQRSPSKINGFQSLEEQAASDDGFQIGVHDWRDPDLMVSEAAINSAPMSKTSTKTPAPTTSNNKGAQSDDVERLSGGSITPGSGEYQKPAGTIQPHHSTSKGSHNVRPEEDRGSQGWFGGLIGGNGKTSLSNQLGNFNEEHHGLWVTLTPTTMSTSPFFDTLLVLVVSPLITLTVVYSLLLIRSRIRRRRWRAPKSVVDRLPIRTYHTMSCSSTTSSSQLSTPMASSPTSPLLQHGSRSPFSRSRPRSRTTSGINEAVTESLDEATSKASMKQREKPINPSAIRRPYHGKQVECVVCLEEYVDGQSKVMSLPCGHEFHAECM